MAQNILGLHLLVRNAPFAVDTPARAAFRSHLVDVARALQLIEAAEAGCLHPANEVLAIAECLKGPQMTKHRFPCVCKGLPAVVLMGWSQAFAGYHMSVELVRTGQFAYSTSEDQRLAPRGVAPTVEYLTGQLSTLGLQVPAVMLEQVRIDAAQNAGARQVVYGDTSADNPIA